ncbi:hypothetical protein BLOT_004696 [Blomia tropicalis]|nr:hypothetical protein BLOT_004696 [Blomia tropicalis]
MAEENNNSRNNNNHGNQTKIGCNYSHDRQPTGYFHFLRSYYLFLVTVHVSIVYVEGRLATITVSEKKVEATVNNGQEVLKL